MTSTRRFFAVPWQKSTPTEDVPVDAPSDLQDAVIGDDLMLIPGDDRHMRLYAIDRGHARSLGACATAAAAWAAIDAFDLARSDAGGRRDEHRALDEAA